MPPCGYPLHHAPLRGGLMEIVWWKGQAVHLPSGRFLMSHAQRWVICHP